MVTHDCYFLDRVVNKIVEIDRRQLVAYPGTYFALSGTERSTQSDRLATDEAKRQNTLRRELEWAAPWGNGTRHQTKSPQRTSVGADGDSL